MKTLVSEINGRKDFPVFSTDDNDAIIEHLKTRDWAGCDVEVNEDGTIEVMGDGWEDTFKIISTEVIELGNSNKKDTYRVFAECTTSCYLDVEASSEEEAMEIAEATDGGDFTSQEDYGNWNIKKAKKIR